MEHKQAMTDAQRFEAAHDRWLLAEDAAWAMQRHAAKGRCLLPPRSLTRNFVARQFREVADLRYTELLGAAARLREELPLL